MCAKGVEVEIAGFSHTHTGWGNAAEGRELVGCIDAFRGPPAVV